MEPVALALVLTAAVLHAAWNRLLHGASDRIAALAVSGLISGVLLLPAMLVAPPWRVLPLITASALAEVAYALCLSAAYRRGALSLTYPVGRGTAPLLVTLGSWIALTQQPSAQTVAAAGALVAGLVLVATAGRQATDRLAIGFAVLTGVTIAAYTIIDARAVHQVSPAGYLGAVMALEGILVGGSLGWGTRDGWRRLRGALRPGMLISVGSIAAYLLVLLALQRAGAGRVATLREISVLIGLLLAQERVGRQVWVGATLVVMGAILAAL